MNDDTSIDKHKSLARFAWLSIAAALITISLKTTAYLLTDSVGLLSDAMESFINLAGALMALTMLTVAARPADEEHAFGHSKAEYFSSGVEGTLILIAAVSIGITAVQRLLDPRPLEQVGIGLGVSVIASLVNLFVAIILARAGKKYRSITLEADAQHLMTDVWTSVGVIVGVGAVVLSGWPWLDPVVALVVAGNIILVRCAHCAQIGKRFDGYSTACGYTKYDSESPGFPQAIRYTISCTPHASVRITPICVFSCDCSGRLDSTTRSSTY